MISWHLRGRSCYLTSNLCYSIITWTYLVVHLQWVSLSFGLKVLCVGVHGEVNLPVEALHLDRVPVLVIQQTAYSNCNTAAAEPQPVVVWRSTKNTEGARLAALNLWQRAWKCVGSTRNTMNTRYCVWSSCSSDEFYNSNAKLVIWTVNYSKVINYYSCNQVGVDAIDQHRMSKGFKLLDFVVSRMPFARKTAICFKDSYHCNSKANIWSLVCCEKPHYEVEMKWDSQTITTAPL